MARRSEESEARLARYDPFQELELFAGWSPSRELGRGRPWRPGRLLDELLGEPGRGAHPARVAIDCCEDEKAYIITVEVPGAKREDIHIDLQGDMLTIRGEKKSEREDRTEHHRWAERTYGSFSRSFTLPRNALADRVEAAFRDGVLTLTIPKTEESKPKTVTIKS
jgi:HSP20 family protein